MMIASLLVLVAAALSVPSGDTLPLSYGVRQRIPVRYWAWCSNADPSTGYRYRRGASFVWDNGAGEIHMFADGTGRDSPATLASDFVTSLPAEHRLELRQGAPGSGHPPHFSHVTLLLDAWFDDEDPDPLVLRVGLSRLGDNDEIVNQVEGYLNPDPVGGNRQQFKTYALSLEAPNDGLGHSYQVQLKMQNLGHVDDAPVSGRVRLRDIAILATTAEVFNMGCYSNSEDQLSQEPPGLCSLLTPGLYTPACGDPETIPDPWSVEGGEIIPPPVPPSSRWNNGFCDFDGDGLVTWAGDANVFLAGWGALDPFFDLNHDGLLDMRDAEIFLQQLRDSCQVEGLVLPCSSSGF